MPDASYEDDEFTVLYESIMREQPVITFEAFETPLDQARAMLQRFELTPRVCPRQFWFGNIQYIFRCIDCLERVLLRLGVTLDQLGTSREKLWWRVTAISCQTLA